MTSTSPRLWLRLLAFVAVVAYLLSGPVAVQILGASPVTGFRPWQMYHGKGNHLCDVDYYVRTPEGDIPVDRYALLAPDRPWWRAPSSVKYIYTPEGVADLGKRLCRRLGKSPDLRADARCASLQAWVPRMKRQRNLCRPEAADAPTSQRAR